MSNYTADCDYRGMQAMGALDRSAAKSGLNEGKILGSLGNAANQEISVPAIAQILSLAEQLAKLNYSVASNLGGVADRLFGCKPENDGADVAQGLPDALVPQIETVLRSAIRDAERASSELGRIERQL